MFRLQELIGVVHLERCGTKHVFEHVWLVLSSQCRHRKMWSQSVHLKSSVQHRSNAHLCSTEHVSWALDVLGRTTLSRIYFPESCSRHLAVIDRMFGPFFVCLSLEGVPFYCRRPPCFMNLIPRAKSSVMRKCVAPSFRPSDSTRLSFVNFSYSSERRCWRKPSTVQWGTLYISHRCNRISWQCTLKWKLKRAVGPPLERKIANPGDGHQPISRDVVSYNKKYIMYINRGQETYGRIGDSTIC